MKASMDDREDRFRWHEEWRRLAAEERALTDSLQAWMSERRDTAVQDADDGPPPSPLQAEAEARAAADAGDDGSAPPPPPPRTSHALSSVLLGDLLSASAQGEYECSLERKQLRAALSAVRDAVAPLRGPVLPLPKARRTHRAAALESARAGLEAAREAMDRRRAALAEEARGAEEDATEAQRAVAAAMRGGDGDDGQQEEEDEDGTRAEERRSDDDDDDDDEEEEEEEHDDDGPTDGDKVQRRRQRRGRLARSRPAALPARRRAECASALSEVGGRACEDPSLSSRLLGGLVALRRSFDDDAAALEDDWAEACERYGAPREDEECGGWPRDAHLAFVQALRMGAGKRGAGRRRTVRFAASAGTVGAAAEAGVASAAAAVDLGDGREGEEEGDDGDEDNNDGGLGGGLCGGLGGRLGGDDGQEAQGAAPAPLALQPPPSSSIVGSELADAVAALAAAATEGAFRPSRHACEAHNAWWAARRAYLSRKAAREARWVRERGEFLSDARVAFQRAADALAQGRARAAVLEAHERTRQDSHARLDAQRARKAVEEAVAAAVAAEIAEAERAVAALASEQRKARAAEAQRALERYRSEQAANDARLQAVREQVAAFEAQRRREELAEGAERVGARRRQNEEARARREAELREEQEKIERRRAEAVERLMAAVPYRERVDEIAATSDGERAASHTAASAAAAELSLAYAAYIRAVEAGGEENARMAPHGNFDLAAAAAVAAAGGEGGAAGTLASGSLAASRAASGAGPAPGGGGRPPLTQDKLLALANLRIREKGLFARHGFSERQVTGDKRWRVVSGVWAAGVQGTDAARDALRTVQPAGRGALQAARATAVSGGSLW